MRLISRLLYTLGIILLVLAVTLLLTAPQVVADLVLRINRLQVAFRILLAVLIDVLLLAMLYGRLRAKPVEGLVVRARGVRAEVNIDSVQRQINARVEEVADVLAVQTEVAADNGNARIALRVRARPDIVVPEKQKEINRVLRQVVEKQLGLRLSGSPIIHIALDLQELPLAESAWSVPTGAVEPAAAPSPAIPGISPVKSPPAPLPAVQGAPDGGSVIEAEFVSDEEDTPPVAMPAVEWADPDRTTTPGAQDEPTLPLQDRSDSPAENEELWRAFLLDDDDKAQS
jgi:hypothetical protein